MALHYHVLLHSMRLNADNFYWKTAYEAAADAAERKCVGFRNAC